MTSSRQIPITVHPEFRRRAMSEGFPGKSHILSRSASLPTSNPSQLRVVFESPSQSRACSEHDLEDEDFQNSSPKQSQGAKRRTDHEEMNPWTAFEDDNFFKANKPVNFRHPYVEDFIKQATNKRDDNGYGWPRRHYCSSGMPFAQHLDKVFERCNSSAPKFPVTLKQGLGHTFGVDNTIYNKDNEKKREDIFSGLQPEGVSIKIPVHVEHEMDKPHDNAKENPKGVEIDDGDVNTEGRNIEAVVESKETKADQSSQADGDDSLGSLLRGDNDDAGKADQEINLTSSGEETSAKEQERKDGESSGELTVQEEPNRNDEEKKDKDWSGSEVHRTEKKMSRIQSIQRKTEELEKRVETFSSDSKTKTYLYLEEFLTRYMIELDGIETNGDENIRLARKAAIKQLQKTLEILESKITSKCVQNDTSEKDQQTEMPRMVKTKEKETENKEDQ